MNRRKFLQGVGTLSVLVASGTVWRALDQGVFSSGEGPAYEEWNNWEKDQSTGLLGLIHSAILAASPHNTQPWLFQISESTINIYADTKRDIGVIDPYFREMYIGLGCALENLLLAAKANGYSYQLDYFPDSSNITHAATIQLKKGQTFTSDLYRAIPHRHTNRGAHNTTNPISTQIQNTLIMLGNEFINIKLIWINEKNDRDHFFDLNAQATNAIIQDEQQSESSFHWMRKNWHELQDKKDGVSIDTTGISPTLRAIAKLLPILSRQYSDHYFLEAMKKLKDTTGMAGIMVVKNNHDNTQRMHGGQFWQRMHLWGTSKGLAMQPVNQISERIDRDHSQGKDSIFSEKLQALLKLSQWQPLLPFRIGHPQQDALPSPRRYVSEVVI